MSREIRLSCQLLLSFISRRSIISGIIVLFCLFVGAFAARSQTLTLSYVPVTAEYSNALDRIIFIAANPNQLHIFDPATNTDTAVNLPKPPLSLSVSLDGLHAAVGHDALVSYVNLQTASLEKTLAATTTVTSLVLGNDYVYILTYSGGTGWIQISTGTSGAMGVYNGTTGRLHPSGTAVYTTNDGTSPDNLEDLNVSTGPVTGGYTGPYWGDYAMCGGVWFSPDGHRVYTGCGVAFQANPQDTSLSIYFDGSTTLDTKADILYWGTLTSGSLIRSLTESASLGRIAAIPYSYQYATPQVPDNQVLLYDSAYLEPAGIFQLPNFMVNGNSYQAHGQQVFYNQASTSLYVVMQADPSSGLLDSFAVQIFPLSNLPSCSPTFSAATTTLPATGTVATVGITAPATCIYEASSTVNWIQLISGAYGSGNGTLTFAVRPNSGAQRTGDITLGGQTYAITQPAASTPPNALTPLGYSVVGAGYSKSLDRVIVAVSNPKELHIVDLVGGSDQIVPLPKIPFFISVSPDGQSAAVGLDGWVSIVNLSTATIASTIQVFTDAHTVLLAGNGYFYTYPQSTVGSLFSGQIATGKMNVNFAIYSGRYPQLYADGTAFYTEGSKWNITQGSPTLISENFSPVCPAPFWLTEDGARMIMSCGKAYTTSPVPALDLQYNGSFSNATSIQWATESAKWHSTAVIPSVGYEGNNNNDTFLQIYGDAYLSYAGDLSLPMFTVDSTAYAGRGRYVFFNNAEDKLIVLEQADPTANLTADYGVTVYPFTTTPAGCSYSLGTGSASFNQSGGLNTVIVTTGAACTWDATSGSSWITVNAGAIGFGSNSVGYTVAQNNGSSRTGSITIAGQAFMVTQAGVGTPSVVSVAPSSGSGISQTFALQYSDTAGAVSLEQVWAYFNATLANPATTSCILYYNVSTNQIDLLSDNGAVWQPATLGAATTLQNSQCSLNVATATAVPSGNNLTLNVTITFKPGFAGAKNVYLHSVDVSGAKSGWQQLGAWTVTPPAGTPSTVSVMPNSGSGTIQTFALQYSDTAGAANLQQAWVYFDATLANPATNACMLSYSAATSQINLLNDSATAWMSATLGSAATLQNSQCSLNVATATVAPSGNTLTLNLTVTFLPSFAGSKNIYLHAVDVSGANSGWQQLGAWTVTSTAGTATTVSVTPNSGSGTSQTFAFEYSDTAGAASLEQVWAYFNATLANPAATSCLLYYNVSTNQINLLSDNGAVWMPATLGSATTLQNSQCSLSVATATAVPSGNNLTLNVSITFKPGFVGAKNVYLHSVDVSGSNSGWQQMGAWTVTSTAGTPTTVSVSPNFGSGSTQTFTLKYSDSAGAANLQQAWVYFNATLANPATNACMLSYNAASNQINVLNDSATAWLSATLGAAAALQNSQCSLDVATATVSRSGDVLTLTVTVIFQTAFAGSKNIYLHGVDVSGANSGWQELGTWVVPSTN